MAGVRAVYVLVAILSFATPQVSWAATEQSLSTSGAIVLSTPAAGATQISRAIPPHRANYARRGPRVETDKTFGCSGAIATDAQPLFPPLYSIDGHYAGSVDLPNLDLDCPPLAPRPPPAR